MKRGALSVCAIVLVSCVVSTVGCMGREARLAHEEMLSLRSSIREGMTPEEVEALLKAANPQRLRYGGAYGSVVTVGQSVAEGVPAKEWVLWVSLRQGRAAAVRIRTEDSSKERPRGAPEDIIWQPEDPDTPFSRQARK